MLICLAIRLWSTLIDGNIMKLNNAKYVDVGRNQFLKSKTGCRWIKLPTFKRNIFISFQLNQLFWNRDCWFVDYGSLHKHNPTRKKRRKNHNCNNFEMSWALLWLFRLFAIWTFMPNWFVWIACLVQLCVAYVNWESLGRERENNAVRTHPQLKLKLSKYICKPGKHWFAFKFPLANEIYEHAVATNVWRL